MPDHFSHRRYCGPSASWSSWLERGPRSSGEQWGSLEATCPAIGSSGKKDIAGFAGAETWYCINSDCLAGNAWVDGAQLCESWRKAL